MHSTLYTAALQDHVSPGLEGNHAHVEGVGHHCSTCIERVAPMLACSPPPPRQQVQCSVLRLSYFITLWNINPPPPSLPDNCLLSVRERVDWMRDGGEDRKGGDKGLLEGCERGVRIGGKSQRGGGGWLKCVYPSQ